ncbi:MAG TPA: isochorismatase family protein [Pyrinomonadaceae bacterium]|nr:isochorismatase family protein [Pyrinomonadaceae bacterium]
MPDTKILDISKTICVVVDVQEAFRNAIGDFALVATNISRAISGFSILGVPIVITEQYPKGLGKTAEEIMLAVPDSVEIFEKTAFSSFGSAEFSASLDLHGATQIVLCGFETHVCVNQTAHDLIARGYQVHLLTDCTASRFEHDRLAGLEKMRSSGVVASSAEMALFELMRDSRHPKFREIQNLIK